MLGTVSGLLALDALGWLVVGVGTRLGRRQLGRLGPADPALADGPSVSIIVAARNEADRLLERSVRSFLAQRHDRLEVLVADDHSTDATPEILARLAAEDPRLRVLAVDELPPGWVGKPWAIDKAARAATGEWILATDADVVLHPDALTIGLAEAQRRGCDFLSLVPSAWREDFWVNLVLPVGTWLILLQYPPSATADPADPRAVAYGGYMLYRREALAAVGYYEAVKGRIAEDVALARTLKRHGGRTAVVFAPELVYTPMYQTLGETWSGLSKLAMLPSVGVAWLALLLLLLVAVAPPLLGLAAAALAVGGRAAWLAVAVAGLSAWLAQAWNFAPCYRGYGVSALFSLGSPFSLAVMGAVGVYGTDRHRRAGGVEWRGRRVSST